MPLHQMFTPLTPTSPHGRGSDRARFLVAMEGPIAFLMAVLAFKVAEEVAIAGSAHPAALAGAAIASLPVIR